MNVKQLSVFIENKPGKLQSVLEILKEKNVNILALNIAEVTDFGILRMIVDKPEEALDNLKDHHITASVVDVLALAIDDKPGSLLSAIELFKDRQLNIEYMYAFTEKKNDKAVMIFRFENYDLAMKTLSDEGYDIMKKIDIIGE